jgi:hypothetical protein
VLSQEFYSLFSLHAAKVPHRHRVQDQSRHTALNMACSIHGKLHGNIIGIIGFVAGVPQNPIDYIDLY